MNDVAWCRSVLDRLAERMLGLTQFLKWYGQDLQDLRANWDDTAAREVFGRYLEPQQQNASALRDALVEQQKLLWEAVERMKGVDDPAAEIQQLSEEAAKLREQSHHDVRTSHGQTDVSLDNAAAAREGTDHSRRTLAAIVY